MAVERFAAGDPARSVAVEAVRGIEVRAAARADEIRPAASLLKLSLVAAVHDAAERGKVDLRRRISRSALPRTAEESVLDALEPEHELSIGELCSLSLVTSDNPAADYLLRVIGKEAVNGLLRDLGLEHTRLRAGFGDEEISAAGRASTTTAREALVLVRRLVGERPRIGAVLEGNLRKGRIPLRLPEGTRALNKTGTLLGVVNDAGIVYGDETDVAFAFLSEHQADPPRTEIAIGDCVAQVRLAVGEPVRRPQAVGPEHRSSVGPRAAV